MNFDIWDAVEFSSHQYKLAEKDFNMYSERSGKVKVEVEEPPIYTIELCSVINKELKTRNVKTTTFVFCGIDSDTEYCFKFVEGDEQTQAFLDHCFSGVGVFSLHVKKSL